MSVFVEWSEAIMNHMAWDERAKIQFKAFYGVDNDAAIMPPTAAAMYTYT